jgi:hypothetical protein
MVNLVLFFVVLHLNKPFALNVEMLILKETDFVHTKLI